LNGSSGTSLQFNRFEFGVDSAHRLLVTSADHLRTEVYEAAFLVSRVVSYKSAASLGLRRDAFGHGAGLAFNFSTREFGASIVELSIILSLGAAKLGHLLSASNLFAGGLAFLLSAGEHRAAILVLGLVLNESATGSRSSTSGLRAFLFALQLTARVHGAAFGVPGSVRDIFAAGFRSYAFNLSTAARLTTGGDKAAIGVLGLVLNDLAACFRSSAFDHGAFFLADSFSTRELRASIVELSIILGLGAASFKNLLSANHSLAFLFALQFTAR